MRRVPSLDELALGGTLEWRALPVRVHAELGAETV